MPTDAINRDINLTDKLNIAIERVKKINDPLLVIGLGGTGADIVYTIKKTFAERYELPLDNEGKRIPVPKRTGYLVIDSDTGKLEQFDKHETVDITVSGLSAILSPDTIKSTLKPYELSWVNPALNSASSGKGAGTYRQAARLMLSRNYANVRAAISDKLSDLVSVESGGAAESFSRVNVVIVTGICGGTGSGTFLDIAQIVRDCLNTDDKLTSSDHKITGYIVTPDISCANVTSGDTAMQNILMQNGYAALKELDFWMCVGKHKTPYSIRYSDAANGKITWDMPPFDACVLMSGVSAEGSVYKDAYTVMQNTIAENLLHYLAYEEDPEGKTKYAYISYEDNLDAIKVGTSKSKPLFYGYRTVGAYTKRIPKADIMFYEGEMLLRSFIPPMDAGGKSIPNMALLMDGQNTVRAGNLVPSVSGLQRNVASQVSLPTFLNVPVESLQNMNPTPPHDRENYPNPTRWETDILPPAMTAHAKIFLETSWNNFEKFAMETITAPELGPFCLKEYLDATGENGLYAALDAILADWKQKRDNLASKRAVMKDACKDAYPAFIRPPLLGKQRAIDNYLDALDRYYNHVRATVFMSVYIPALEKFIKRIKEYHHSSLGNMCSDLLTYHTLFGTADSANDNQSSNIYELETVKSRIDEDFALYNIDHKFERQLLSELCEASFDTVTNADPQSSGLTFTFQRNHLDVLYQQLRKVLAQCFGDTNSQSLDTIMAQQVGNDIEDQNKYMDSLIKSIMASSVPMFLQNSKYTAEEKASFSFLSVPDDAQKFIAHYTATLAKTVQPKPSVIRDHLYCVTTWDAVPLYRYNMVERLEAVYAQALANPARSMGIHLVYDGNPESTYRTNWSKLPEPVPYYLFGTQGTSLAQASYEKAHKLIDRAIACGLVQVDYSIEEPIFTINLQYADARSITLKTSEMMIVEIDELPNEQDPITRNAIQPEIVAQRVAAYLKKANAIIIQPNCKPATIANNLGLANGNIDPWDLNTRANPTLLAEAERNFKALSEELAVAVCSRYPSYMLGIEMQLEAAEHAKKIMDEIAKSKQVWLPRIAYAPTFAKLFVNGLLYPSISGFQYVDLMGAKVSMIQAHLLATDLVNDQPILKNAAYLGDLDHKHSTIFELEQILKDQDAELVAKSNSGTLTAEDLHTLIARIDSFIATCTLERNFYKTQRRSITANMDRFDKIDEFYQAMIDTVNGLSSNFKMVLQTLA